MTVRSAEDSFQKGMAALAQGRRLVALAQFEAALALHHQFGNGELQARYVSFYGLCLALEAGRVHQGLRCCEEALATEFYNVDLHFNLGRVLLAANRRRDAHRAFLNGLHWDRSHAGILRELRAMGKRRRPVLPFLSRSHFVNVVLGRMTRRRTVSATR